MYIGRLCKALRADICFVSERYINKLFIVVVIVVVIIIIIIVFCQAVIGLGDLT